MVGGSWRIEVVDGSQQTDILGWMFQVPWIRSRLGCGRILVSRLLGDAESMSSALRA